MADPGGFSAELKFVVEEHTAAAVREWVGAALLPDPYSLEGGGYRTSSLYFDTATFDLFNRRGSTGRAKFRIRRYNGSAVVFLERKQRVEGRLTKRRSEARLDDLWRIGEPETSDWSGRWFSRRLRNRNLLPACQIDYRRTALIGELPGGPLRLTIDSRIFAQPVRSIGFSVPAGLEILPGRAILELKHVGELPPLFKRLIEEFGLAQQSFSKYRAAARSLGFPEEMWRDFVATGLKD